VFEGEFDDDTPGNEGTMTYPEGESYTGSFVNNKREG